MATLMVWVVPRQNSSGGKERLGKISKQGDRYLRQLLVIGVRKKTANNAWVLALLEKKPPRLVTVALANSEPLNAIGPRKQANARISWAIMSGQTTYRGTATAA